MQKDLQTGIKKVFTNVIKLKKYESMLIFTCDDQTYEVGRAFFDEAKKYSQHVTMVFHPVKQGEELMEEAVRLAFTSEPDVFIITNLYKEGIDKYALEKGYKLKDQIIDWYPRYLQLSKKSRGFFFIINSVANFAKALNTDYEFIRKTSAKLVKELDRAVKVIIKDDYGTDLEIDLSDKARKAIAEYDGTQHLPGKGINLPPGEVLISPVMGGAKGVAYIDLEFYDEENMKTIMIDKPIEVKFKNGIISSIKGGKAAARFKQIIASSEESLKKQLHANKITQKDFKERMRNCRSISEFAIGVHPGIKKPWQDLLFDEKIAGTCHIAFGSSYDSDKAPYHSDFIFSRPIIFFEYPNGKRELICQNKKFAIRN